MKQLKFKRSLPNFVLLASIVIGYCFISDYLIEVRPFFKREYWALYDGVVHGLVGAMIVFPVFKEYSWKIFLMTFFLSAIIDIDHFILAGSLSVSDAINLPMRPITHSLTFALLVGGMGMLFFKRKVLGFWIFFATLASHVIRDASSGLTLIFYPATISVIPVWSYYVAEVFLLAISWFLPAKLMDE